MFRCSYLAVILGFGVCCGCTGSASAENSDRKNAFYEYAHNKIGLLRYCRRHGLVGSFVAEKAAQEIEVGLPDLDVDDRAIRERGDRAEKMGEAGFWDADGREDLASVARRTNTSPASICGQLAGVEAPAEPSILTIHVAPKAPASDAPAPGPKPQPSISQAQRSRPAKSPVQGRNSASPVKKPPQQARAKPKPPAVAATPTKPAIGSSAPASAYLSPSDANKWLHDRHARPWTDPRSR
jgi:hypothetical protein